MSQPNDCRFISPGLFDPKKTVIAALKEAHKQSSEMVKVWNEGIDIAAHMGYTDAEIQEHIQMRNLCEKEIKAFKKAIEIIELSKF